MASKTKKIEIPSAKVAKTKANKTGSTMVVVGPVAIVNETPQRETSATPLVESGMRPTRLGNAFEATFSRTGELIVRYHDHTRRLSDRSQVLVVADPGKDEDVVMANLVRNGAVLEGRTLLSPKAAKVALAFVSDGGWDSNESRNYHVTLRG